MAHYYKLPNDFYCWGQDRGGTLIPLISQLFIKLFDSSALFSVSISNYVILVLGYIGFSSLVKSNYYKVILAFIWFFPFQRFIDLVRYPIGVEYSLIGFAIFLISKLEYYNNAKTYIRHFLLVSITLLLSLAIWVSDLSIVTIIILLSTLLLFNYIKHKRIIVERTVLHYLATGALSCFIFIKIAKSFAISKTFGYLSINGIDEIKQVLILIKEAFGKILTFSSNELLVSLYTYLVLFFIFTLVVVFIRKRKINHLLSNKWFVFFFLDLIVILIVLFSSSWVLANGVGRWYFVGSYISLSMVLIFALETLETTKNHKLLKYWLLAIVIIGALSPLYTIKHIGLRTFRPMADVVGEFAQLGKIGIIGDYWNSYVISCKDPEMVVATPHDQSSVRNQQIVDKVFEREDIYVIKDMWMETFPDTLNQFGYTLVKEGKAFKLGGCDVNKYAKIKLCKIIPFSEFKYSKSQVINENGNNTLHVSAFCDSCTNKFLVYGPYIPIVKGKFKISFSIKAEHFQNNDPIALLDVVADWGKIKLAEKTICKDSLKVDDYYPIDLSFSTPERYRDVEFRIRYYGNADLYFDHVVLKEL